VPTLQVVVATAIALFLLRWAAAWALRRNSGDAPNPKAALALGAQSLRREVLAWLMAVGALVLLFLIVLLWSLVFGPLRPIHEWWT
jgi:hypothetical protein